MIQASFNDQSELNYSLVQWIKETPGIFKRKNYKMERRGKRNTNDKIRKIYEWAYS